MTRAGLAVLAALLPALSAHAARVVVVPLDGSGQLAFESAQLATRTMLLALRDVQDVTVMESKAVSAELGVNLVEQVQLCHHEVLCLVQIGDAVSADKMLLGEIVVKGDNREIKLYVVDVTKAAMIDTMSWTVTRDDRVLEEAVSVAVRQLFSVPDARVVFEVEPRDAQLELYGERANVKFWEEVPFWSGTYYARVAKKGYEPRDVRIVLPRGGPTRVVLELAPDLLYVDPNARTRPSAERNTGKFAVVTPDTDTTPVKKVDRPSPFANLWAWGLVAVGAAAGATGGLVMVGAQSDYNALSAEARFVRGTTTTSMDAIDQRDDARSRFGLGSKVMIGGIVVGVGGLVWMLVDSASSSGERTAEVGSTDGPAFACEGGGTCGLHF